MGPRNTILSGDLDPPWRGEGRGRGNFDHCTAYKEKDGIRLLNYFGRFLCSTNRQQVVLGPFIASLLLHAKAAEFPGAQNDQTACNGDRL